MENKNNILSKLAKNCKGLPFNLLIWMEAELSYH